MRGSNPYESDSEGEIDFALSGEEVRAEEENKITNLDHKYKEYEPTTMDF